MNIAVCFLALLMLALVVVGVVARTMPANPRRNEWFLVGLLLSAPRLACFVVLLVRTWTHHLSYSDLVLMLPLLPEIYLFDLAGFTVGSERSTEGVLAAVALAALLVMGSFLMATFLVRFGASRRSP